MSPGIAQRLAKAEQLHDYFDLQLRFAQRIAEIGSIRLGEAVAQYTNFHRRFGFGRITDASTSPAWTRYVARLEQLASIGQQAAWTCEFFVQCPAEKLPPSQQQFGCFACDAPDDHGALHFHFVNSANGDGAGPLARANMPVRLAELRAMFAMICHAYPSTKTVRGASWLYNLEAYRRLFPPGYGDSRMPPTHAVRLDGSSSWGQFLDHRGRVKTGLRDQFLQAFSGLDICAAWKAFPLPALRTSAPIEQFYEFYEIRC